METIRDKQNKKLAKIAEAAKLLNEIIEWEPGVTYAMATNLITQYAMHIKKQATQSDFL